MIRSPKKARLSNEQLTESPHEKKTLTAHSLHSIELGDTHTRLETTIQNVRAPACLTPQTAKNLILATHTHTQQIHAETFKLFTQFTNSNG